MSPRARLAAVACAFALPLLALAAWSNGRQPVATLPGLDAFPEHVGPWRLTARGALSSEERAMLKPDSYLAWEFAADGRPRVSAYVALYRGPSPDGQGAHDPALCYPASGWEVLETRAVQIPLPRGGFLSGKLLRAHKGGDERLALYWFQPAGRWPRGQSFEQLARIGDALAGRPQFAFVRLSAPSEPGSDVERHLVEFAAEISAPVRGALTPGDDGA